MHHLELTNVMNTTTLINEELFQLLQASNLNQLQINKALFAVMFEKQIVIDGKGHLLGRLASVVAKELLNGQKIVVVRCESIMKSASLFRNKIIFNEFLNKWANHKPTKWIQHYRSPSRIFWRVVRGMVPHKTQRGVEALGRLKVMEGCPAPYDKVKKQVIPTALKIIKMKNHRQFCVLGDLSASVGWNKQDLVKSLETKRIAKCKSFYDRKLKLENEKRKAENLPALKQLKSKLEKFGY